MHSGLWYKSKEKKLFWSTRLVKGEINHISHTTDLHTIHDINKFHY